MQESCLIARKALLIDVLAFLDLQLRFSNVRKRFAKISKYFFAKLCKDLQTFGNF